MAEADIERAALLLNLLDRDEVLQVIEFIKAILGRRPDSSSNGITGYAVFGVSFESCADDPEDGQAKEGA